MNRHQENSRYIIQQLQRHGAEFADAETVAVQGIDDVPSLWYFADGRYVNMKLGRAVHWLVVVKPKSLVAGWVGGKPYKVGQIDVIFEQDLAAHPGITILRFDKDQNLTIDVGKH